MMKQLFTIFAILMLSVASVFGEESLSIDLSTVESDGDGYTYYDGVITLNEGSSTTYRFFQSGSRIVTNKSIVANLDCEILLDGVNLQAMNSPIDVNGNTVVLLLKGDNELACLDTENPGIRVEGEGNLTIRDADCGRLNVLGSSNGAGIGGGNLMDGGTIIIQSGVITAQGGVNAAGIGGGNGGGGANLTIEGGIVTASGGHNAAGIGGGSSISPVESLSQTFYPSGGICKIIGGNVVSISLGGIEPIFKNDNIVPVYPVTISVLKTDGKQVDISVGDYVAKTKEDGSATIWLPVDNHTIVFEDGDGVTEEVAYTQELTGGLVSLKVGRPTVTILPENNATRPPINNTVKFAFDEPMDRDAGTTTTDVEVRIIGQGFTSDTEYSITYHQLEGGVSYTVNLTGFMDKNGNSLEGNVEFVFTTVEQYKVSFETEGDVENMPGIQYVDKGTRISTIDDLLGRPSRIGYEFEGWLYGESLLDDLADDVEINENIVLTAQWKIKECTITAWHNDGTDDKTEIPVVYGQDMTDVLPVLSCEEAVFAGWFTEAVGGVEYIVPATYATDGDLVLYAQWTVTEPTPPTPTPPTPTPPTPTPPTPAPPTQPTPPTSPSTPAAITGQPANAVVYHGDSHTFTVVATGAGLNYQWYKDGQALPGNKSTYTIGNVQKQHEGFYYVVVTGAVGNPVKSTSARLTVTDVKDNVSINEVDQLTFRAYPNPTTDFITVTGLTEGTILKLYGASGAQAGVYTAPATEMTINLAHLPQGMYYLTVEGKVMRVIKK